MRRALPGYGIGRRVIAETALLGQAQPPGGIVPPGGRGHIDFGGQFPYDPEKAKAPLQKAGFGQVGCNFQQYIAGNMTTRSVSSCLFLQVTRASVKGYEHLHGFENQLRDNSVEQAVKEPSRRPAVA